MVLDDIMIGGEMMWCKESNPFCISVSSGLDHMSLLGKKPTHYGTRLLLILPVWKRLCVPYNWGRQPWMNPTDLPHPIYKVYKNWFLECICGSFASLPRKPGGKSKPATISLLYIDTWVSRLNLSGLLKFSFCCSWWVEVSPWWKMGF